MKGFSLTFFLLALVTLVVGQQKAWIRVNQLGYLPDGKKVAVWVTKGEAGIKSFKVVDAQSGKVVFKGKTSKVFGAYGPFSKGYRLDFSKLKSSGAYYIVASDGTKSSKVKVNEDVYNGTADFTLRYMRQQRTLFNPYLKDSCHTHDGFTMYASSVGMPDSTRVDVGGGWHDASDYLQYATTSANATYHLLAAYRDFPSVFSDEKQANGLDGNNGIADVLDEAKWGLDWLVKMHPKPHIMFNQIADDRDHTSLRLPGQDSLYGRGHERPVYFIDGKPQQRGKFLNNTTGTSSTAAKFVSAFGLGYELLKGQQQDYAQVLKEKAKTAYQYAHIKPGVTQTVSVKSPYIYAEDNWVDDMELAEAWMHALTQDQKHVKQGLNYARQEAITPWMVRDTANHYQYYPFINLGHYELAKSASVDTDLKKELEGYYRQGIEQVWRRAKENMFFRGVPFIWCSNNLTTSFAIQCLWYRELTGDQRYEELEQANVDWLFGVNPWGTSMVYGLPADGDTPVDPHSAFTYLHKFPIDGGLVDGPVYTNTYSNLIGIKLTKPDEYADFQSDLMVYHDDFGDYSTNEPTMDGTASLIYLLSSREAAAKKIKRQTKTSSTVKDRYGAIVRGDTNSREVSLLFTGDEFRDGLPKIAKVLKKKKVKGSFFVTGRFLDDKKSVKIIQRLLRDGHCVGPHSDQHLLYMPWEDRTKLLVSKEVFTADLQANMLRLKDIGVKQMDKFVAPYEWYNDSISQWSSELGLSLYNYTPGLRTATDYTYPEMGDRYWPTDKILQQVRAYESQHGLNGFLILVHLGTDMKRKDKLYNRLEELINEIHLKNYKFVAL